MVSESSSVAPAPAGDAPAAGIPAAADGSANVAGTVVDGTLEDAFFRRGEEEDQAARQQLRHRLATMPRWPGLGWAIALLVAALLTAAVVLLAFPPS
jgi:hypothetical protein